MARRWEQAGGVFPGKRGMVVATLFGVSRAAAYQRMYRYRRGFYEGKRPPRPATSLDLRIEFVYDAARAPEPEQ